MLRSQKPNLAIRKAERKIKRTIYKFLSARGLVGERLTILSKLQHLRCMFRVSKELFLEWFKSTLQTFSGIEHGAAHKRVMPIYLREQALAARIREQSSLFRSWHVVASCQYS